MRVRQKALRVMLIHAVASGKMLLGRGWHHAGRVLHHAVMLHAACRGSQLLPDVEGEMVRGEERYGPLYRKVRLGQRDQAVLLHRPLLLLLVGLRHGFVVLHMMLHWFRLDDARQLVAHIGNIAHPCKASWLLT